MSAWRKISEGERRILAIDFDSTARPEADFQQFAELLQPGWEIWLTTQPEAADTSLLSAETYLEWWRDRPEGHVDAVMGYCVGCVFIPMVVDEIASVQGSHPAQLLFDPEPVVTMSLYRDFAKAVDSMGVLSPDERAGYIAEAQSTCESDFTAAAPAVIKLYETAAGVAFDRLGLDEETSEELFGLFRSYVSYLSAAHEVNPTRGWASGVALTSSHSSPGAAHARSEQCFPVTTQEMLNDPRVARTAQLVLEA